MLVFVVFVFAGGSLALLFIVAPLLRSEDELESFDQPRPGMRNLNAATDENGSHQVETEDGLMIRCPNCGTVVDGDYKYCGDCATQLSSR
jgi:hypothetical protein